MLAKSKWERALSVIIKGSPDIPNPIAEPITTITVMRGEINIARKIATWLAKVKEAGGMTILIGITSGITIASAVKKAVSVIN